MNTRSLAAFLLSTAMSGCLVVADPPDETQRLPGDVTFEWSLAGGTCAQNPEVQSVRISIPGEALENGGVYPCLVAGYQGIVLHDFAAKSYSYSIEALGFGGEQLFVGSGVFTVNGDITVRADLQQVSQPGDVTFTWSFGGESCAKVPDVESVRITIAGETIENGGVFPCMVAGYPGVVLYGFSPKSYAFTIEGGYVDGTEFVTLFATSSTFAVNGDVAVTVDVQPVAGPNSYAYVSWTFPPNAASQTPNCQQAGVAWVDVSVDGGDWVRYACEDGFDNDGVVTDWLTSGQHSIEIVGLGGGASPYMYYRYYGTLTTTVGAPRFAEYTLPWAVGGVSIRWTLSNGTTIQSCAQAGVTWVYVNFQDAQGNWIYGVNGDAQLCSDAPILYNFLHGGTYKVLIEAQSTRGTWYVSNEITYPTVTVVNGEFVTASSPSTNIQMIEQ